MLMPLRCVSEQRYGAAGREWIRWLANIGKTPLQPSGQRKNDGAMLVPSDYGEQVLRVASRFAVLEAALRSSGR